MSATYPQYPHSKFPDELDSWETFLDVVASDAVLLSQYQQYVLAGDMENAQYIYQQPQQNAYYTKPQINYEYVNYPYYKI